MFDWRVGKLFFPLGPELMHSIFSVELCSDVLVHYHESFEFGTQAIVLRLEHVGMLLESVDLTPDVGVLHSDDLVVASEVVLLFS